jgi:hypothetical protein
LHCITAAFVFDGRSGFALVFLQKSGGASEYFSQSPTSIALSGKGLILNQIF